MRCLLISTFEQQGGAARSAHRLYRNLSHLGIDGRMLVQYKQSDDPHVLGPSGLLARLSAGVRPYIDALPVLCYRTRLSPPWSLAWLPNNFSSDVTSFNPDLIHLNGVGHGFLSLDAIGLLPGPLIWTMHDSWAFTGGCHLPGSCDLYHGDCGRCPQLNARHERDLSRWVWNRKSTYWPKLDVTFVAPSRWLARCAESSSLLRSMPIEVIPNGIDTLLFAPGDRSNARAALGLPPNGLVLLYGASSFTRDINKGFAHLASALSLIAGNRGQKSLTVVLFGDSNYQDTEIEGISVRSYGSVSTAEKLILLYRAADLYVLPSLQENLPNTVMEAMACGTPCVAFDVGGLGDLISHMKNGYLARAGDVHGLAEGITWLMADSDRRTFMGRQARQKIESGFSINQVAERYLELYQLVIDKYQHTCRLEKER